MEKYKGVHNSIVLSMPKWSKLKTDHVGDKVTMLTYKKLDRIVGFRVGILVKRVILTSILARRL